MIIPGAIIPGWRTHGAGSANSLKKEDADAIEARCDLVSVGIAVVNKGVQVVCGLSKLEHHDIRRQPSIILTSATLGVSNGNKFSEPDEQHRCQSVCGRTYY